MIRKWTFLEFYLLKANQINFQKWGRLKNEVQLKLFIVIRRLMWSHFTRHICLRTTNSWLMLSFVKVITFDAVQIDHIKRLQL